MNSDEISPTPSPEEIPGSTPKKPEDLAAMATHQIEEGIHRGRAKLTEMKQLLSEATAHCARTTDHFVQDNPWKAAGWATLAGVIVGLLIRKR